MTRYDAIVVGTGQAGPPLAGRMDEAGWKVAVLERERVGGTCVNHGCIPTKALVASARAAHVARRAADFGVVIDGEICVDMKRVKARMDEIAGSSNRGVTKWLEKMKNVTFLRGHGTFVDARTIRVGDEILESERIFLNVGARARVPELTGIDEVDYLTNTSMLELDSLPEHLIVVGASYIGLEFGQMYRRFGSRVTIVERGSRPIAREDEDVSAAIREHLEDEGVRFRFDAECIRLGKNGKQVSVGLDCEDEGREVVGSHVLLAVGRVPNTDSLGLGAAGVETDEQGHIVVDEALRTSVPGIWALGDCNGRGAFTHTSYNDYEIVESHLFGPGDRSLADRIPCYGLYVDPPLGRAGMTEAQARVSGRKVLVAKLPMSRVGRAKERSETKGFMKILVDADSHEILGAAILGIRGDEVVHSLLDVMYARAPYTTISRAVHIHPTVSELVPTALQDLEELDPGSPAARPAREDTA